MLCEFLCMCVCVHIRHLVHVPVVRSLPENVHMYVCMYVWSLDCRKAIVAPKDLSVMNTAYIRMYLRGFAGLGLTEAVGGLALRRRRRQAHRDDEELPWPSSMYICNVSAHMGIRMREKERRKGMSELMSD